MDDLPTLDDVNMTTPTDDSDNMTLPIQTQPVNPASYTDDEIRDVTRPSKSNSGTSATGAIRKQPPEPQPSRISPRNIPPEFLLGKNAPAKPAPVQQPPLRPREYHPANPQPFDYRTGNSLHYEYRDAPPLRRPAFRNQGFEDNQYNFPRPSMSSNSVPPSRPTALAAYEVMRKWNLKFSGARNEDAEAFLARIDEGRSLIDIRDDNKRETWHSFAEFKAAWRRRFVNPELQFALREEIRRQTQGESESVSDYSTYMRAYFDRLRPAWEEDEQLDYAYRNLLPRLQILIRRDELQDLDELEDLASRIEISCRVASNYQAPPTPERSVLLELAYRGQRNPSPSRNNFVTLNFFEEDPEPETGLANATQSAQSTPNRGTQGNRPNGRSAQPRSKAPRFNSRNDTSAPTTPTATTAHNQTDTANVANNSPEIAGNPFLPSPRRTLICYQCRKPGHRYTNCPEPATGLYCFRCGKVGYTKVTCPNQCA
ncbi:uncharacterized protein LOC124299656 [Neodiprion virginianus]|uniref:uncharacterized protein LOC124299656 n=1 Tax=Neodiprion virginianus TaxID=2961670 RepID=UPI001EE6A0D6|nr:uncharacterized protein LOC124299656 [Neodiprion virginianus]